MREPTGSETRRRFIGRLLKAGAGALVGVSTLDAIYEKRWLQVTRPRVAVQGLPPAFDGMTLCHITDLHHGPWLDIERVVAVVDRVLSLRPHLIAITGDMVHRDRKYIEPVWRQLGRLRAPFGVCCVMGNHDHWEGIEASRAAARAAGIAELRNAAVPVHHAGQRLWLAGVGDLWEDTCDAQRALEPVYPGEPVILLSHNPDVADDVADPRVRLILAGHTHGGQVRLPLLGPILLPSKRRYAMGLVETSTTQMYVSRGIGTITPPVRMNCRPELPLITLKAA